MKAPAPTALGLAALALLLAGSPLPAKELRSPKASKTGAPAKTAAARPAVVQLAVGKAVLKTEIVDNDSLRAQGLSDRKSMPWDAGMLFVFPDARQRTFWMIDCSFDLDIAYLDPQGVVRDIQTMVIEPGVSPENLARYVSRTDDIMYALEVNRGWFASQGLRVGDRLESVVRFKTRR